jgi:hypothetical protein
MPVIWVSFVRHGDHYHFHYPNFLEFVVPSMCSGIDRARLPAKDLGFVN